MAKTPEGIVKDAIKAILTEYGCWFRMPVSNGMGGHTVDFYGLRPWDGKMFVIEAKAPGEKPTPRQQEVLLDVLNSHGGSFCIDGQDRDYTLLRQWLTLAEYGSDARMQKRLMDWITEQPVLESE